MVKFQISIMFSPSPVITSHCVLAVMCHSIIRFCNHGYITCQWITSTSSSNLNQDKKRGQTVIPIISLINHYQVLTSGFIDILLFSSQERWVALIIVLVDSEVRYFS